MICCILKFGRNYQFCASNGQVALRMHRDKTAIASRRSMERVVISASCNKSPSSVSTVMCLYMKKLLLNEQNILMKTRVVCETTTFLKRPFSATVVSKCALKLLLFNYIWSLKKLTVACKRKFWDILTKLNDNKTGLG